MRKMPTGGKNNYLYIVKSTCTHVHKMLNVYIINGLSLQNAIVQRNWTARPENLDGSPKNRKTRGGVMR
jgi:hypothetical protein